MPRILRAAVIAALVFVGLSATPSNAQAVPVAATAQSSGPVYSEAVVTAWVHQCAAMHCGYHEIHAGTSIKVFCRILSDGLYWDLIVAQSPWNPLVPVAGYVESWVTDVTMTQSCSDVPVGTGGVTQPTWLHSCPNMWCGYGVAYQGDDIAAVCLTSNKYEGHLWVLLLDHDRQSLAGFVHLEDSPPTNYWYYC